MKVPKSEKLVLTYKDGDTLFYITQCADSSGYVGYKDDGGKLVKLCKKKNPLEIEELFSGKDKGTARSVKKRTKKVD